MSPFYPFKQNSTKYSDLFINISILVGSIFKIFTLYDVKTILNSSIKIYIYIIYIIK